MGRGSDPITRDVTHARAQSLRVRNVLVALALIPGFASGFGWLALGGYAGQGTLTHLFTRCLGLVLVVTASNCALHLAKDSSVWQTFVAYFLCFGVVLLLLWVMLAP
jgi:hypothetical protein